MNNKVNSFSFFRNYYEFIKELNKKDKADILIAIIEFVFEDKEPDLKGLPAGAWAIIKTPLEISKRNSINAQNKNESINKTKTKQQTKTKRKKNETINENKTASEKEKEKEEIEREKEEDASTTFLKIKLSDKDYKSLVSVYPKDIIDKYITKVQDWSINHNRTFNNPAQTIKDWIAEDIEKNRLIIKKQKRFEDIQEMYD